MSGYIYLIKSDSDGDFWLMFEKLHRQSAVLTRSLFVVWETRCRMPSVNKHKSKRFKLSPTIHEITGITSVSSDDDLNVELSETPSFPPHQFLLLRTFFFPGIASFLSLRNTDTYTDFTMATHKLSRGQ